MIPSPPGRSCAFRAERHLNSLGPGLWTGITTEADIYRLPGSRNRQKVEKAFSVLLRSAGSEIVRAMVRAT